MATVACMTETSPLDLLRARGFVQDITDEDGLRTALANGPITYYVGFDPSSPSLHIGHLVGMMAMAWLQRAGHRPIALAGGGTGRIGDPSGRDDERELLDEGRIASNLAGIRRQLSRLLDLDQPTGGLLLDNNDWLGELEFVPFLRDVGKHFSVNQMIARESVRRRLIERDHGISFTEFSYQLLQAYDFAHLFATHGCVLQGGGSDQWGNITAGIDLTRRLHGGVAYGIVWPLIARSDGKKMSASTGDAVWLDPALTSPFAYYQWFLNLPDADAGRFLRLFTFIDGEDIDDLESALSTNPAGREAQRTLATEATRIFHGDDGVARAVRATEVLFGDQPFTDLDDRTLADAFDEAPSVGLPFADLEGGAPLARVMVDSGAASSLGEARRLIAQGGVRVNNARVDDPERALSRSDLVGTSTVVLRVGRKRYYLARFD